MRCRFLPEHKAPGTVLLNTRLKKNLGTPKPCAMAVFYFWWTWPSQITVDAPTRSCKH